MKANLLLLAGTALLLCSCGSSGGTGQPTTLTHAQRYDATKRAWVPANTVMVREASVSPNTLAPEKSSETAKVLNAATTTPVAAPTEPQAEEKPGLMKRMGRAATSPLRLIGIGDDSA